MTRCPFHDWLEPYLADRLGDADQASLVAHIPDCPDCQRELEALTDAERTPARASSPVGSRAFALADPREVFLERLKQLAREPSAARTVVAGQPPHVEPSTVRPSGGYADGRPVVAGQLPHVEGYEIEAELGRGAMGVVYKARQVSLKRLVALKMVLAGGFQSPKGRERFLAEAAVVARLHHPNVVQIFECR
ncbi:MAG TPA: protein kinase, partial [Gemmataceae bacterium]|nr:protein kinase [Gemmataceae bacterium]